jgi:AmiR/NasT family two-component response regulator
VNRTVEALLLEDAQHELVELRAEVAELHHALETRELIGQATGILVATFGCSSREAFQMLVRQSQHTNQKLRDIARTLVQSTSG